MALIEKDFTWKGQATVEMAVVFPIVLVLLVIAFNAVAYLGVCASFDRIFTQQVRVFAAAPSFGSNQGDVVASIQKELSSRYGDECSKVEVVVSSDAWGSSVFRASLEYEPSLFGLHFRSILFGIELPTLHHERSFALNCYRPGIVI